MFTVEKNGVRHVLDSDVQLDAFLASGWDVVTDDFMNKPEEEETTDKPIRRRTRK